jgi:hypothetical protein
MKFLALLSLLVFFTLPKNTNLAIAAGSETDWEFISEDDGIKMFERWIESKAEKKVRERQGKMVINVDLDEVVTLISDEKRTHLWMNNVESAVVLKRISATRWVQRTVLDAPWPFSKQDMVSDYNITKLNNKIIVNITPVSSEFPPQKNIERLDTFVAKWEIEPLNNKRVQVTFTTTSTIPPKYPAMVQDPVVRKVFLSNLRNFKKLLNQK